MLHEEVEKYINLSGDKEAWQNTSVSRIRGYLDGYDKGLEVLDKIRAEIMQVANQEKFNDEKWALGLRYATKIIDKYKAESEPQESEDEK